MSGFQAKKSQITPSRKTYSYQWAISIFPRLGPAKSVVTPLTISWCAWCEVERSNGDFRSLMVSTIRYPMKIPGRKRMIGTEEETIELTKKLFVTIYIPTAV